MRERDAAQRHADARAARFTRDDRGRWRPVKRHPALVADDQLHQDWLDRMERED